MPRLRRIQIPGEIHHVMSRGIEGRNVFADDRDRRTFLNILGLNVSALGARCYAWALLPNHYHLVVRISQGNLSEMMRRVNGAYARHFNRAHERRGYVFMDRFKSLATQEQTYFREMIRYVNLNPLRAGIVKSLSGLARYPWCSHQDMVGRNRFSWVFTEEALRRFTDGSSDQRAAYIAFLAEGAGEAGDDDAAWMRGRETPPIDTRVIGDPEFVRSALERERGVFARRRELRLKGVDMAHVAQSVANAFGMPVTELRRRGWGVRSDARSVFAHLCRAELGASLQEISEYLGLTSAAGACLAARRGENRMLALGKNIKI